MVIERPALYIVATPIGNLGDITSRAVEVLQQVDSIAAEDTRVSAGLLRHLGVQTPCFALQTHNEEVATERVLAQLAQGLAVAQISDAGTPCVSDPGARLVARVSEAGYKVIPIPGASAVMTALCVAGMLSTQFLFYGFLPPKTHARQEALQQFAKASHLTIFFEAPHRIVASLEDMIAVLGADRRAMLARELTKLFETIHRGTLGELLAWVKADANQQRGEFVVIIESTPVDSMPTDADRWDGTLIPLLEELPTKQAVQLAVAITGAPRNVLYDRALVIKANR